MSKLQTPAANLLKSASPVRVKYISSYYNAYTFYVDITVPEHTVSLHSNSPKLTPILSESSFTLTCTAELNPAVDVPVTVNTVWTGPDGTILTSATRSEKKSFTLYASVNTLHSVDSADSGNYTCTVTVEDGVEVSASTNITIGMYYLIKLL